MFQKEASPVARVRLGKEEQASKTSSDTDGTSKVRKDGAENLLKVILHKEGWRLRVDC